MADASHTEVERLDRTQPPRGYLVWFDDGWACVCWGLEDDGQALNGPDDDLTEETATSAAWAHYEAVCDPPGMVVIRVDIHRDTPRRWGLLHRDLPPDRFEVDVLGECERREEARAAAWAWYWRRVALAAAIDAYGWYDQRSSGPWPRVLKWTDEQVEEVEKWLAWQTTKGQKVSKNPALPEVFRV